MNPILLTIIGLIFLFIGGEILIRGAVSLARKLKIPTFVIGSTIVGLGTSLPELVVSVQAAMNGSPDIALGNVVGSNIANILLMMGLVSMFFIVRADRNTIKRDGMFMLGATCLLYILCWAGTITAPLGTVMLAGLIFYIYYSYKHPHPVAEDDIPPALSLPGAIITTIAGLALIIFAGNALVTGATELARIAGVSEAVIGLTLVAVGTSFPELAASFLSAWRGHPDIALGNIVGSNIYNALGIIGATSLIHPVSVAPKILHSDLPIMVAITILFMLIAWKMKKFTRITGIVFFTFYIFYIAHQFGGVI